jgi:hypothetical protein
MPMDRLIILLFVFIFNYSVADSIDDVVKKQTDSLKASGIEKVFVHQYSLFNGRYNIPYDTEELRCADVPTVVHIFWFERRQWNCLRLDKCGLFEIVKLDKADFDKLNVDEQIEFKKGSAHFTTYRLTKLYRDSRESVLVSGAQLTNDRNDTIKTFKKVNKVIKRLEDNHKFKRVQ